MSRYIDADLMKQSIPNTKMDEFENCRYCRMLDEEQVKDLIDQQPTADVRENIKGEWIAGDNSLTCPRCGAHGEDIRSDFTFNFCPNCGAQMMRGEA